MNSSTRAFQSRSFVSATRNRWDGQLGFFEHVYLMALILGVFEDTDEYLACIGAEHTGHFSRPVAMYSLQLVFFRFEAILACTRSKIPGSIIGVWFGFSREPTTI